MKLRRPVQRDQQCFDRRQELYLWVFIGRPTRLLPHAKVQVDYALEGSTFSLSKCDFSHLYHTERSWYIYRFTVVSVSGRQDLPSDAGALFFFDLF